MAYVTEQDLVDRFGEDELIQLTDRNGTGAVDQDVLLRAIDDAQAEVDSYLSTRYAVPLTPVPTVLALHAANVVRYRLYEDGATEEVEKRYKQSIAWLKDVSSGRAHLDVIEREDAASGPAGARRSMVFTGDCLARMPGVECP